ncbi:MAG: protoporphyrinogen oxidase [Acidobacteriaceae bacterium]
MQRMREHTAPRVAVIGGGISGLAAAFHLRELADAAHTPLDVQLLEQSGRIGGSIQTLYPQGGWIAEAGPDVFVMEKPWALALVHRLGLGPEVLAPREEFRHTHVVRNGRLVEIPEGFLLMAPVKALPFLLSPLLSPWGKLRVGMEPLVPRRKSEEDETLASFVQRRFGHELLDRVVQPLLGGIYSADPSKLSLRSSMPRFAQMEGDRGSVLLAMWLAHRKAQARKKDKTAPSGPLMGLRNGMGTLVDALAARLEDDIRTDMEVTALDLLPRNDGWRITLAGKGPVLADAVICAAPTHAACRLLEQASPRLASGLRAIEHSSVITVNLAFRAADCPPLPRSHGFVVPFKEHRSLMAATFVHQKFIGRVPEDVVLLRAFLGGALQPEMMGRTDEEIFSLCKKEFRELLGLTAAPIWAHLARWDRSLPQYMVGHQHRIADIQRELEMLPGLALAGSAFLGGGLADCIHSGEIAAEKTFAALARAAENTVPAPAHAG